MDGRGTVTIAPTVESAKWMVGCQCELGREKLLTAPPFSRIDHLMTADERVRYTTAPCAKDRETYKCPLSHVLVTFRSPLDPNPNDQFKKIFPSSTPIKLIRRKLAKLLSISNNNLLLTKNRNVMKDTNCLSDYKADSVGNLLIDVYTKDAEDFSLANITPEYYVHDLLQSYPLKKRAIPFIAIKFNIRNQKEIFTKSYHSIMKVHEVKKNLGGLFKVDPDNIELFVDDHPLNDRMALFDLDYDQYGIVEVDLLVTNKAVLDLDKLYKECVLNEVLAVEVRFGNTMKKLNVEVFCEPIRKPFLGGYKNKYTGIEYHHAYTQTPQKPEKLPPEKKNCRDTQTAEEREKVDDTPYNRATQMQKEGVFIPNVTDRILVPKPYETYDEMRIRLKHDHYASIIQRAFRHHQFRQKVERWLKICMERIARMKEEERLELEAIQRRLRRDLITKTFPKTRQDFDQLYAMVDRWKHDEIERISQLHSKGPKIAEFTLLLDKEVELLRCIESYRFKVREDSRKLREQQFLDEICKPVAWFGKDDKLITMETIEIQKARKLKELYNAFLRTDMEMKERMELLVDMKFALTDFRHPLAEDIITLLDRECDLLVRRCSDEQLDYLRRRIARSVFQFIKTSELNSGVTKMKDVRDYKKMENTRLHYCEKCNKVKPYADFPIDATMSWFLVCKSCSWKDVQERLWVDMTPYKFILKAVQQEERRRQCYGSSAFVLQERDICFIVEKLWHSHSAISESSDVKELRLCRWDVNTDWSPWNCFLVTGQEMTAHMKLENPLEVYDEELIQKVTNTHRQAKANFAQLMVVNKQFTESGEWQGVRAPAVAHVDAVERLQ